MQSAAPSSIASPTADKIPSAMRAGLSLSASIFLGAFLLFQVQPLLGKFILPWFGGTPAVWTSCLLFFQSLLLAGYAYAHVATRWLSPKAQAIVHCALLAGALLALPIIPGDSWKPDPAHDPILRILAMLAVCVGLPYFVLSATGPLLQVWFHRLNPTRSPYRLYALSNVGSLLALISYPFLIEPNLSRQLQARIWSIALAAFAILCAYCALRAAARPRIDPTPPPAASPSPAPRLSSRLLWIFLPAVASMLLLATTNKLCQDVSAVPLLWIAPLALYLITFIISFDHPRWYIRPLYMPLLVLASIGGILLILNPLTISILTQIVLYSIILFVCCMVAHGEVARLKPDPARLGAFYLSIALGGALGALAVAVGAPLLFKSFAEFWLALLACCLLASLVVATDHHSLIRRNGPLWALAALVIAWLAGISCVVVLLTFIPLPTRSERLIHRSRNFYGVIATVQGENETDGRYRKMVHGAIQHGFQFTDPARRREATSYYGPRSGIDTAVSLLPTDRPRRIGVVGLGAGTLAIHPDRDDAATFYEINPQVWQLAETDFTYLQDCRARLSDPARLKVELGDARLVLERQTPCNFDLLALDAFSGDAIPVHLVTHEAFQLYLRHLAPGGIICINVTNHHLDLRPVVTQIAAALHLTTAIISHDPRQDPARKSEAFAESHWILISRDPALRDDPRVKPRLDPRQSFPPLRLWTDEYSSLVSILRKEKR